MLVSYYNYLTLFKKNKWRSKMQKILKMKGKMKNISEKWPLMKNKGIESCINKISSFCLWLNEILNRYKDDTLKYGGFKGEHFEQWNSQIWNKKIWKVDL